MVLLGPHICRRHPGDAIAINRKVLFFVSMDVHVPQARYQEPPFRLDHQSRGRCRAITVRLDPSNAIAFHDDEHVRSDDSSVDVDYVDLRNAIAFGRG